VEFNSLGWTNGLKELGIYDNKKLDQVGIYTTWANAEAIKNILEDKGFDVYDNILTGNYEEITKIENKIVVAGGKEPGRTTDGCAAEIASIMKNESDLETWFMNLTTVPGLFDSNPEENPNANLINELSFDEAEELCGGHRAGKNLPIDLTALEICKKYNIPIVITNLDNMIDVAYSQLYGKMCENATYIMSKKESRN